jgi:hypothetical protein
MGGSRLARSQPQNRGAVARSQPVLGDSAGDSMLPSIYCSARLPRSNLPAKTCSRALNQFESCQIVYARTESMHLNLPLPPSSSSLYPNPR